MTDPMFEKMETLENCIKIDYLQGQLGWSAEQVSYELNFNLRRMTEWRNARTAAITRLLKSDPIATENIKKQLLKDYPLPQPEKTKKLKLDADRVVKCLIEGKTLPEIAKSFRCDFNNFRIWHNENLRLINEKVRQKSNA